MDISRFDLIVVNTSGGKDSVAMLDVVCEQARGAGVLSRVVAVHADLGRVEWPGTRELAERQAHAQGVRLEVCSRMGGVAKRDGKAYRAGEQYGDLLDYVERRGRWPDAQNRYCTSDFKRGPIGVVITRLARQRGARRVLSCMGMRAQESPARAKRESLRLDDARSNGRRRVWEWLPLHDWTEDAVWERIRSRGLEYHPAYDLGMPRLSCSFCIFAPRAALVLAGIARPDLLAEYARVERAIEHTFRHRLPIAVIQDAVESGERPDDKPMDGCWNM